MKKNANEKVETNNFMKHKQAKKLALLVINKRRIVSKTTICLCLHLFIY